MREGKVRPGDGIHSSDFARFKFHKNTGLNDTRSLKSDSKDNES